MSLITFFSAPKAFTDAEVAVSQRNAIASWRHLSDVDVLLLGDEDGLAEAAHNLGVRDLPGVTLNQNGVPLISSMFVLARAVSQSPLLCIINADIILMDDFVQAARIANTLQRSDGGRLRPFVMVSQRWDLDVPMLLEFGDRWDSRLRSTAREGGRLHRPTGSDFFLFPRDCYMDVPEFAIGRAGWDNWMIYKARKEHWPVIDCTPSVLIVHQNHDYRHLPGAKPHYDHPDTQVNTRLAGGQAATRYTLLDSTHELVQGRLMRPKMNSQRLMRKLELLLRRAFFFLPEDWIENVARPKRWSKRLTGLLRRTGS